MDHVEAVRAFNRFYTRQIGVLQESLLHSAYSLTEARVLYELARRRGVTATALARDLGLDPGYVSRLLGGFERGGLLARTPSPQDGRQTLLSLTPDGFTTFEGLDRASREAVGALLAPRSEVELEGLVDAMTTIREILGGEPTPAVTLRHPEPGDLGWVVERHGRVYAREYGWDTTFEALVAEIVARFGQSHDPARERCWIADRGGRRLGSVFLVHHPERPDTAKLRLLLVEPEARGLGLGHRLVHECTLFARSAGYERIVLWTNSVLDAARRLYEREGYRLIEEEPRPAFGHDLVSQTWELSLGPRPS